MAGSVIGSVASGIIGGIGNKKAGKQGRRPYFSLHSACASQRAGTGQETDNEGVKNTSLCSGMRSA